MEFGDLLDIIEKSPDNLTNIQNEYMYLLSTLTLAPELSPTSFLTQVRKISEYGSIVIVYVLVNGKIRITGSGTLIVEPKLIHSGKSVGHIEDVVVHPEYRKRGISGKILEYLKRLSVQWNCYKIILDCAPGLKAVYEKSGFRQKSIQMAYYIEDEVDLALNGVKNASALIPDCAFVKDFMQRNGFSISADEPANLFIYFVTVQEDIPFIQEREQEKIREANKLLNTFSENANRSDNYRILYIVNVLDLTQKYKFVSCQNVDFLYISTISQVSGSRFEWEKDNSFLDKLAGTSGLSSA